MPFGLWGRGPNLSGALGRHRGLALGDRIIDIPQPLELSTAAEPEPQPAPALGLGPMPRVECPLPEKSEPDDALI